MYKNFYKNSMLIFENMISTKTIKKYNYNNIK